MKTVNYDHEGWRPKKNEPTKVQGLESVGLSQVHSMPAGLVPTEFELAVWEITDSLAELLIKKHKDYGSKNISQSPGGPLNGLRVRIHDKTARINNLVDSGAEPENESLIDSFMDLANYAIIGQMVLKGKWDKG
jgi:hypothetical protein